MEYRQLMEQSGTCATFHIYVKYRQSATWQEFWHGKKESGRWNFAVCWN